MISSIVSKINGTVNKQVITHYAIIIFGIALCLTQYFANRSLWIDEAFIANNIIERNFGQLLQPLDYDQIAPILFLQFVKLFSTVFPGSEFGLRLFPLLSYCVSLILFYRLSKLILNNGYAITLSLLLFVFNTHLIYYSSELKQYMSDILVLLILFFVIIKNALKINSKYFHLILWGSKCVFLSNITPIILLTSGVYLIVCNFNELLKFKITGKLLVLIFISWVVSFIIYYFLFIHEHPTREYMLNYWKYSFAPNNPFAYDFYRFLYFKTKMIFFSLFTFNKLGFILFFLYAIGIIRFILNKDYKNIVLLLIPLITHLILSSIKLYPFDVRLILYFVPIIIISLSYGFEKLIEWVLKKFNWIDRPYFYPAIPLLFFIWFFYRIPFPFKNEEIKESLKFINGRIGATENLYVYYGAVPAFNYYYQTNYFNPPNKLFLGSNFRNDKSRYISEIRQLSGATWLLFSHPHKNEEALIIQQLDALGYHKIESFKTIESSAYLVKAP